MLGLLGRLCGVSRADVPPREDDREREPQPPIDPELQQILGEIDQKWTDVLQRERAAEALLTPRERIKKRLNLPTELPADYRADESVPVLAPVHKIAAVPMIVVVNNV